MEYCSKCFEKLCRCGSYKVEIDYYIYPTIYELNRKGYRTASCCSGHESDLLLSTYISFYDEIEEDICSEYFQFDSYSYRGFHERRNCIRVKQEISKKFKKKRTNKLALIQNANKDLYTWAQSLPERIPAGSKGIIFPEDYFDKEVEYDDIIDVQKPWILLTKASNSNFHTIDDFFNEIGCSGALTELVVNRAGRIKRFCDQDHASNRTHTENGTDLKDKIIFDSSGDFRYLLCGYEPYVVMERICADGAVWYLSYARTDIAIQYGDHETREHMENLFDEDDIEDFWDEHPNDDELDLFTHLFNRLCRMKINICVFSADNINVIFSNKTDFCILTANGQNVVAFGKGDYEYIDFSRVRVEQKEVFIYANGRLLMRKEVE